MSHVFHRHTQEYYPTAMYGNGCYIIDHNGKRYLDGSSGAAVSHFGHTDPVIIQAIKKQLDRLPFAHTSFFTTEIMETLADTLIAHAPVGIDRVYFVSGGSEAIEAGIKLARHYFVEIGQPQRTRFIARRQSFHGNTLGALAVGHNLARRLPFEPLLMSVEHIMPCYAYRDQHAQEDELTFAHRCADDLEQTLVAIGPDTVAAFIAEPIVGATLGAVPAVAGYFKRIREICDRYGVLLLLDEIMCGVGCTGTLFVSEQEEVRPDMITIAKGLGAGYQPIGALLVSDKIYNGIEQGCGFFQHGYTYMGHVTACAAAVAVLDRLIKDGLLEQVKTMGEKLQRALHQRFDDHPHVGDIRGRGLFLGLELVADRATKQCFPPQWKVHHVIKQEAMAAGLICYPMGGTIDGQRGDHILLSPPFIIEQTQIEEIVDKLGYAIDRAIIAPVARVS